MKSIFTSVLLLSFSVFSIGQNASPNLEPFELPTLPECWQTVDEDGDGFNWNSWFQIEAEGSIIQGNDGVGMMMSASFDNVELALTPDNYLILPQLDIQTGENLTFYAAGLDPDYSQERYSVVLSTTGDEPADFTETLFTDTLNSATFVERNVDLSAYEGQQVYVAFRHHNITDQFVLRIDDVQYPTTVNDCAIVVGVEEEALSQQFAVYPNPTSGIIQLELASEIQSISILEITGKEIMKLDADDFDGIIDLTDLPKGIYLIQAKNDSTVLTERIIIE